MRSAEQGDHDSMYNIAYFYEHGIGTVQDVMLAIHW
jgi:TPR repeat protein